jgi:hypothetical protein
VRFTFGGLGCIALPILHIRESFPVPRDAHEALCFAGIALFGGLPDHSGGPTSQIQCLSHKRSYKRLPCKWVSGRPNKFKKRSFKSLGSVLIGPALAGRPKPHALFF